MSKNPAVISNVSRKQLLEVLQIRPWTLWELAQQFGCTPKEVAEDLQHLRLSLVHQNLCLQIEPARCRHCGFVFGKEKIKKPGKCPKCKRSWILEPKFWVEPCD
ncbi:MAG: hypothetical protein AXA67_06160 [Methylothermaceae bacteria B42]|nr:MAG: hypothetical protein AXA67_06160 [Methylothermaceae bacteria B42]